MVEENHAHRFVKGCCAQGMQVEPGIGYFVDEGAALHVRAGVTTAQSAQPECAVAEKSEPDAGGMCGDQQQVVGLAAEDGQDAGGHHRQQKNAADRQFVLDQHVEPGRDDVGVGQRGKQETVIAALAVVAADQRGRTVWRVAVVLAQLAFDHLRAVGA